MRTYLLVAAHPEYPDPLAQARAAVALAPQFAGMELRLATDDRLSTEHVVLVPVRKRWWQR